MTPVRFTVSGGDFELPSVVWDVQPAWANVQINPTGVIEISGTPSVVLGSNTTYTYTVNVQNSSVTCGGNDTKTGQITIISTPTLTLTDATAEDQSLCEGDQLIDIIYNLGNGADDVVFNWTSVEPIGVSADFSISGNSFEIKGTPQVVGQLQYLLMRLHQLFHLIIVKEIKFLEVLHLMPAQPNFFNSTT